MPDNNVKHPEVKVRLVGQDGNVFNLLGIVSKALKKAGHRESVSEIQNQVFGAQSYDEALSIMRSFVSVS